jgi:hypothetical protein
MVKQILPNNNEKCYNNFSATFREVNTPRNWLLEESHEHAQEHDAPTNMPCHRHRAGLVGEKV